ncbi:GNAT family N-acetyltransferase [Paenibacillus arenilitoris]|uniref:Acetyltransferase n=1 Tax=Paenibacillus arenilitoris TaxID=2772299 RepID=A0A927H7T3_9BACL|nr:GNAT family N-acetyltransferase [Paenibacillus arenilitoris]MBD2871966.1 acetyltransferase [Paenibacillus arenilitoris]
MGNHVETIAQRVESAETNTLFSRLSGMMSKEGNPEQVYIERFGNAHAFMVKGIPDPYFNSVRGVSSEDIDQLDRIIEFYRDHNVPCRFDMPPFASAELLLKLAERGYYQYGFHSSMCGSLPRAEQLIHQIDEAVSVRKIRGSEFSLYGEIYVKAFNMPEFLATAVSQNNLVLEKIPGWHFFLASYRNVPAAVAALYVQDGAGSLAAAATLPDFRGKGCHSALLAARIKEAIDHHCDLIVGQARFGSISQGNMERYGLKMAYTKSIWKELPK